MMEEETNIREKAGQLENEASQEIKHAHELLEQGEVFESVDLEIGAVAKEREAIKLKQEYLKEHDQYLAEHPVSNVPFLDREEDKLDI